jgi:NAD(P)-dependent dehydrogenase (short-subunit alcohol dehydrogenase family)
VIRAADEVTAPPRAPTVASTGVTSEHDDGAPPIAGKVVVITGASRGLGAGMAEHLAAAGARLGLCARTAPAPPGGDGILARSVDVTDAAAVEAFAVEVAGRLGPIDLWVNNAGVLDPIDLVADADPAAVAANLSVNVLGVVHGSQSYIRHVRGRAGDGVLVNISSGAAHKAYAGWGAYCASKAAVERLTEVIGVEEADHGLRAYAVAPGVVDTDMQAAIRATPPERMPGVGRFLQLKEDDAFNRPAHVARFLAGLAFDPAERPGHWSVRVPDER